MRTLSTWPSSLPMLLDDRSPLWRLTRRMPGPVSASVEFRRSPGRVGYCLKVTWFERRLMSPCGSSAERLAVVLP